ncbi:Hsp20/alpha crystallin family protein [Arsenicitalea aurantiaca]|nr:Hsp20/alpha crystallin family protein [Arsenicitalea aurantiaca]
MTTSLPWRPFETLRREFDRLLEDMDRSFFGRGAEAGDDAFWRRAIDWRISPSVDVLERDKAYEITAELAGVEPKDIEISVANGVVTLRASKSAETEHKDAEHFVRERQFGRYERSFGLPADVDAEHIEAHLHNGVLRLVLPRRADAVADRRTITVKAA